MNNIKKYSRLSLSLIVSLSFFSSKTSHGQENEAPIPSISAVSSIENVQVSEDAISADNAPPASVNDITNQAAQPAQNLNPIEATNPNQEESQAVFQEGDLENKPSAPQNQSNQVENQNTSEPNLASPGSNKLEAPLQESIAKDKADDKTLKQEAKTKSSTKLNQANEVNQNQEKEKTKRVDKKTEQEQAKQSSEKAEENKEPEKKLMPLKSLMINEEDLIKIDSALQSFLNGSELLVEEEKVATRSEEKKKVVVKENENSFLHLGSILYNSDKIWSVWINNKKITSSANDPEKELYIKSINRNKIDVTWKMSLSKWKILSKINNDDLAPKINDKNQVVIDFTLRPNQTFILKSQQVVEGKVYID